MQHNNNPDVSTRPSSTNVRVLGAHDGIQRLDRILTEIGNLLREYRDPDTSQALTPERIHEFTMFLVDSPLQQDIIIDDVLQEQLAPETTERPQLQDELERRNQLRRLNDLLTRHRRFRQEFRDLDPDQGSQTTIKFHSLQADESLAGNKCGICLDIVEVGRRMVRLGCSGQHVFCQDCVLKWFADHNTCPICRHQFC